MVRELTLGYRREKRRISREEGMKRGDRVCSCAGSGGGLQRWWGDRQTQFPCPEGMALSLFLLPLFRRVCKSESNVRRQPLVLYVFLFGQRIQAGVPPPRIDDDKIEVQWGHYESTGQRPQASRAWVYRTKGPWEEQRTRESFPFNIKQNILWPQASRYSGTSLYSSPYR